MNESQTPNGALAGARNERPELDELLLFVAVVSFGISVKTGPLAGLAAIAGSTAVVAAIAVNRRLGRNERGGETGLDFRLLIGVGLFGLLSLFGWSPSQIGPTSAFLERAPGLIWIGVAMYVWRRYGRLTKRSIGVIMAATILTVAGFGVAHIQSARGVGLDVYLLHVAAADALASGENPYTDAVTVPDGSPNATPEDVIVGYPYPPITALAYSIGDWVTPDVRYTSLFAWLVVIASIGVGAVRRVSKRDLIVMLLLASVPGMGLVLRAAWTEPLSLMFATIAAVLWLRPVASGGALGALLASKQYFFVTAPVLVFHRDGRWLQRLIAASGVVLVTVGPALLWDASAFWDSAVAFHTSTDPRADSANVVGLLASAGVNWSPPTAVPLVAGLAVGLWAAVRSRTRRSFLLAMGAALATSFLFTSQAFANYWLMVYGLTALALLSPLKATDPNPDDVS